jgi:hypothetical protein
VGFLCSVSFCQGAKKYDIAKKLRGLAMRDNGATRQLSRAAKEAMKEWKAETGIKAILPKTENQKMEKIKYNRSIRARERHELRKVSIGAASEVRIINPKE